jgi:RNA polymerase sigma-70 factor (ECF subfamily)
MLLTRDATEAEAFVQETYFCAIPRVASLRVGSNLKNWLFAILRNIWLKQLRCGGVAPKIVAIEMYETIADTIIETSEYLNASDVSQLEHDRMRGAIQRLPVEFREIILLREFEELSYREISEILNCPPGTVMSCLVRARTKLRALLSSMADPSLMEGRQR